MDFQSLNRRELQALCKRNKIPANITNVAMAEALTNLENVEGLEDLMTGKIFADTPAKTAVKPSASRTTARTRVGAKKAVAEQEEENEGPVDLVRRKMDSQFKEAADEEKKGMDTPAPRVPVSRRKTGISSVREVCSTRRSTRLLGKKIVGMNLEDAVDQNIVDGISQQKKPSDLQEKTDVPDEKPVVAVPQDGPMDENNEDYVLVDHKDAELIEEKKDIGGPTDGLVFENQKGINAVEELEEAYKAENVTSEEKSESDETVAGFNITKDDIVAEESMKVEYEETLATVETVTHFINNNETGAEESMKVEAEEDFAITEIGTDSINTDEEPKPQESNMDMEVFQIGEAKSEEGVVSIVKDETKVEKTTEMEVSQVSEGNSEQAVMSIIEDETEAKESMETTLAMNENVTDSTNKEESKLEESVKMEIVEGKFEVSVVNEDLSEHSAGFSQLPNVETITFETAPVVSKMETVDHFGGDSERKSPKATENTNTLLDTNKENFMKEKKEKVKKEEISIRQLKKMLKQLNIADKTTSIKEGENTAKDIGRARPALQPLVDN